MNANISTTIRTREDEKQCSVGAGAPQQDKESAPQRLHSLGLVLGISRFMGRTTPLRAECQPVSLAAVGIMGIQAGRYEKLRVLTMC